MKSLMALFGWVAAIFLAILTATAAAHHEYVMAAVTFGLGILSLALTGNSKDNKKTKKARARANGDGWW